MRTFLEFEGQRLELKPCGCEHCDDAGPDPGWLYTDNNGPIVACPICNKDGEKERAWELAELQRDYQRRQQP